MRPKREKTRGDEEKKGEYNSLSLCVYVYTGEEEGDVEPSFFDDEPTRAK